MIALSSMWERIQSNLFPFLEEEVGELTAKQGKLVSILEIIRIEESITYTYKTGRPPADRKAIARAYVAKAVYNSSITREFDPAEKTRYNERTAVERVFGRLKDEFGGRMVRVRGSTRVMAHLMFGILALTADQLLKFVQ